MDKRLWLPAPEGAVSGVLDRITVLCSSLKSGSWGAAVETISVLKCSGNWTQRPQKRNAATAEEYELKINFTHVILHTWVGRGGTCAHTFFDFYSLLYSIQA